MSSGSRKRTGASQNQDRPGDQSTGLRGAGIPEDSTGESDERYRRALAALVRARSEEFRRVVPAPGASSSAVDHDPSGTGQTRESQGPAGFSESPRPPKGSGVRPPRTIYVLHETSAATKGLRVALIWMIIVIFMATADALSPQTFIQVSAWLSLFFLGVLLSFWAVFNLPRAAAATWALIGTFLGPYSLTWQLWVTYDKHWKGFFPVRLYPFPIVLDELQWYAMMVCGFIVFGISVAVLVHLSRPRPTYVRVRPDSGEAYRLGDPP